MCKGAGGRYSHTLTIQLLWIVYGSTFIWENLILNSYRYSGHGFQTIQFRTRCINYENFVQNRQFIKIHLLTGTVYLSIS